MTDASHVDLYVDVDEVQDGAPSPSLPQLAGRFLAIKPTSIEKGAKSQFTNDDGTPKFMDTIRADVTFLDGAPITTIEKQDKTPVVLDEPIKRGVDVIRGMYFSQAYLVQQLEKHVGTGGVVFGRLIKDLSRKKGSNAAPWVLMPRTEADTEMRDKFIAWRRSEAEKATKLDPAPVASAAAPAAATLPSIGVADDDLPF